ncbi:response regulator [Desulfurobacterium indicum]|uniref:Response regulatory domain-containing protein n=1 Tax=Desulfurobacterium indicum TaxID=1914305 RepID=A0A1R1MN89_9BACT|nr:response regulator [Desulfurobacterium indicum]OMH41154.1 hypothetical protein BLW93_01305 [Desulfurobacterium indicum]
MKVLYADAKKTWHTLMEKVLKPRGVELIHAETLKEVLNKVNTEKPEVAVINVSLKNGKAYEIIPNVLAAGVPVILIGLKSEGFDEEKAKQMGVKFILPKPFTVDELFRLINEARLEKSKVEVKKEEPGIVLTGGKKEHAEDVEITPTEEIIEIEPSGENLINIDDESELEPISIEPQSEEESIAIQPIEGGLSLEIPETEEEEKVEKEKLAQAFGISKEQPKIEYKEIKEEISPVEEKTAQVSQKTEETVIEKTTATPASVPSQIDINSLKQEIKQELLKEFRKEMEETIKSVAWEVIPDMAEKVIREEIEKFIRSRLV